MSSRPRLRSRRNRRSLEFSGPTKTVLIPSRVLRCQSVATIDYRKRSKGACAFKRPLALKDLVTATTPARRDTPSSPDESVGTSHAIVGEDYRDGRLNQRLHERLQSVQDPHARLAHAGAAKEKQFIELTELDALFFMRDSRDHGEVEGAPRTDGTYGRKVALLLPNGEEITGSTLNYSRHASGVFMYPLESDFGVARVFVTQRGIKSLRLL